MLLGLNDFPLVRRTARLGGSAIPSALLSVFLLAQPMPARAQANPSTPATEAPAPPFGALSLFVLTGTLVAGLITGAGIMSLRQRAPILRRSGSANENTTRAAPVPASRKVAAHVPTREMPAQRGRGKLPPVAAVLSASQSSDCEGWLDDLANGPRFGPRLIGFLAGERCDKAEAIAFMADRAKSAGRDVAVIDACGESDQLAEAFDRRLGRRARRHDPFGASARIEVIALPDLFAHDHAPSAAEWREAFDRLTARNDVVLVVLPPAAHLVEASALLATLDDIAILRAVGSPDDEVLELCADVSQAGARPTQLVLVESL